MIQFSRNHSEFWEKGTDRDSDGLAPSDIFRLDEIRRAIRAKPYRHISHEEAARAYEGLPGAAHSSAIEGNPLTKAEYALQLLLIEERIPAEGTADLTLRFMAREDAGDRFVRRRGEYLDEQSGDSRRETYLYAQPDAEGREVLRNLADLRDAQELDRFERIETTKMGRDLPRVTINADGLRAIHHHLFRSVYAWAGQFRATNLIGQFGSHVDEGIIEDELNRLFRDDDLVTSISYASLPDAAERLARLAGDINAVQPFRTGNGSVMRAFIMIAAREAGWMFDEAKLDGLAWGRGSVQSLQGPGNSAMLAAAIESAMMGRRLEDRRAIVEPPENDRLIGRTSAHKAGVDPVQLFSSALMCVRQARETGIMTEEVFQLAVGRVIELRRLALESAPPESRSRLEFLSSAIVQKLSDPPLADDPEWQWQAAE